MAQRIEVLQAGRAIAALSVVALHAQLYSPTASLFELGIYGVDFFFLLSGYIIYSTNSGRDLNLPQYLGARAKRIFLPYWPIGLAAILGASLVGNPFDWFASLFLLPGLPALSVAWTLQVELAFYLLAGLFFLTGHPLKCALVWGVAILAAQPVFNHAPVFALQNLEFIAGMIAARFIPMPAIKVGRTLNFLGDASYSIYLAHVPVMGVLWRLGYSFPTLFCVGVLAGVAYHLLVEKPALGAASYRQRLRHQERCSHVPRGGLLAPGPVGHH